jgi:Ca2+-binding RTX toxin-like protein
MGGAGNDALTGNTLANVLTGGAGDDILTGGTGSDSYLFDADASLGTDTLVETVTGGTDLLDFTGTSAGVTLDLALATTQVINTNLSLNLQNGAVFENITGGDGADTLLGNSLINTLTGGMGNDSLNGAGNNDSLIGGGGDDALAGGTGNDSYVFNANTALGSDTLVELAGEGIDLITFATTTTKTVTLNLGLTTLQTVATGTLNLTLNAADTFENLTGGSLADTLTGNILGNVLIGGPGNDMLAGAAGDDVYSYTTSAALGTDTLIEVTGEGADTLDFSLTTTLAVVVNLGSAITQVVNANLSVVLNAVDTFENATGGSLNDTLTGNSLANRLVGNAGLDTLAGGAGNDTLDGGLGNDSLQGGSDNDAYLLDTDLILGTDTLTELAGGGIDTLDFSQTTTKSVAVNLGLITPQLVTAGNLTLTLNAADTVEHITGGSLNDTLTGNALANRIDGGGGLDALQGLAGDDTLIGGLGNDSYLFNTGTALGTDTLDESAGGLDTLDFSASTTLGVTVNLGIATTQVVNANLSLILQADNTFENVFGGSLGDWLTGNALANTLMGNDGPDNVSGGAGNDSLNGGLGDDTYRFAAHSALGTDTLNESAGGTDTLDFSGTTSTNVTLNLGTTASQVVNTNLSLVLGLATAFENAIGGGGNDLLTGNTIANVLTGGAGHDTLVGLAGNDILQGGLGDDSYVFAANAALGTDSVVELAGEGLDLLDLSFSTVAVNVNLGVATTQVVNANLSLTLNASDTFEMVIGSSVNDTLTGNSLANVILGGAGNDAIAGLTGRDLLFGGSGNDSLDGGDDEDIVIGGLTTWFNETTKVLDRTATTAIWTEWTRTDLLYASRITNLKNGGGLNGTFKLSALTVLTDTAAMADTLTGGLSLDWFWQFAGDVVSDLNNGGTETVN